MNANSLSLDGTDSWLSQLIKLEIRELQSSDKGIQQKMEWVGHPDTQPQCCPPNASHVVKSLWAQKKYTLKLGMECCIGIGKMRLKLVIPPSMIPTVLAELHDSPTAGHLGVARY